MVSTAKQLNRVIKVDPLRIASLFANGNLPARDQQICESIVRLYQSGDFAAAKKRVREFTDPQLTVSTLSLHHWDRRRQFAALISKFEYPGARSERDKVALAGFLSVERRMARVNRKLAYYSVHPSRGPYWMNPVLNEARRIIGGVLGPCDYSELARIIALARPGSGTCIGTQDRDRKSVV